MARHALELLWLDTAARVEPVDVAARVVELVVRLYPPTVHTD